MLTSALKDGISSQGGKAATLTDSQLGDLTEALVNARYSQKQECAADDYGYEFLKKQEESLGHGAFIPEIEILAGTEWWFIFQ